MNLCIRELIRWWPPVRFHNFDDGHCLLFAERTLVGIVVEPVGGYFCPTVFYLLPFGLFQILFGTIKLGGFVSGGQEPIVPDAYKTPGKYMGRKPPEELYPTQGSLLLFAPIPVVLVMEAYRFLIHINQAMVTDGYLMGIPAQIFNHCFGRSKWSFGIDYPFGSKRLFGNNLWDVNPFAKISHKPGPENDAHRPFGKQVLSFVFTVLPLTGWCYPSPGDDTMQVRVQP